MPIEIIKYLCQFHCGCKAKSTFRQIQWHEAVCFKNPERKACTTCNHEYYEKDSDDSGNKWMTRGCSHEKGSSEFDELLEKCDYHNKPLFHIQPIVNCPYYEQK